MGEEEAEASMEEGETEEGEKEEGEKEEGETNEEDAREYVAGMIYKGPRSRMMLLFHRE